MERTTSWWGWVRGWPTWVKILVTFLVVWLLLVVSGIVAAAVD